MFGRLQLCDSFHVFRSFLFVLFEISLPCTARERSMSVTLLKEAPWSCFFLLFLEALLRRRLALESPHMLVPPCVDGIFKKVIPCNGGPSLRFSVIPSHFRIQNGLKHHIHTFLENFWILNTHNQLDFLVQIFTGGRKLLWGGVFKVPQFVLHTVVELLRVLLSLLVKLWANGGVLKKHSLTIKCKLCPYILANLPRLWKSSCWWCWRGSFPRRNAGLNGLGLN